MRCLTKSCNRKYSGNKLNYARTRKFVALDITYEFTTTSSPFQRLFQVRRYVFVMTEWWGNNPPGALFWIGGFFSIIFDSVINVFTFVSRSSIRSAMDFFVCSSAPLRLLKYVYQLITQLFTSWKENEDRRNILIRPFSSRHKGRTQMEYPFLYAPGLCSTSFSIYCTTQGAYRNCARFLFADVEWWNIAKVRMLN